MSNIECAANELKDAIESGEFQKAVEKWKAFKAVTVTVCTIYFLD